MLARKAMLLAALATCSTTIASAAPAWVQWTAHIPCFAFQSCADITLQSRTSATGTIVSVTYRNPYNVAGIGSSWSLLSPLILDQDFLGAGWYAQGAVEEVYGSNGPGSPDLYINAPGTSNPPGGLFYTFSNGYGVIGCAQVNPGDTGYLRICPQSGFGGALTFYFSLASQFTLRDLSYVDLGDFRSNEGICNNLLACTVTVAPEPATWALLGGGLALIAVANIVRRRRQKAAA